MAKKEAEEAAAAKKKEAEEAAAAKKNADDAAQKTAEDAANKKDKEVRSLLCTKRVCLKLAVRVAQCASTNKLVCVCCCALCVHVHCCLLHVVCCTLPAARDPNASMHFASFVLSAARRLLHVVCCTLSPAYCLQHVAAARCLPIVFACLTVVSCIGFAAWCLLHVGLFASVVWCPLDVSCWMLSSARCLLHAAA